ncbi:MULTISPECIES: periplasmic heavy metal sensor [unclassified Guyparkeria]|uniref:Spy/CpxP family protein refolding chaperone n=1 Tax=unclassified Guyparkeria TaxID=2626246 RepID=UPI0007335295|nr:MULTISPECIES: periplasmic heavy metal sensor [unclassified Guyparkeria]KTG17531.1 hypothetical protein AUR63_07700 [Guyparkeria sp. XI15]OAE88346.1 hypothetical protein AWR35_07715 [Guyparkeria sp. WRN-7]
MKQIRLVRNLTACSLAVALLGSAPMMAVADDDQPRRGMMGPGMMDGYGPYGPGYGMQGAGPCAPGGGYGSGMMGPGMMHGYGPGMMQGYGPGYGQGMMQGYGPMHGYGGGMMQGYGPGMMAPGYGMGSSNLGRLTEKQRERMRELQQEEKKEHWERMQKMQQHQRELYRMQLADEPNYDAIKEKSRELGKLQQEMAEERIEMHRKMRDVLEKD